MSGLGQAISVAATAGAFAWLLGPMILEEARAVAHRWHVVRGVCRGCGQPMDLDIMHTRGGVPFCCPDCADQHPIHYPEEY